MTRMPRLIALLPALLLVVAAALPAAARDRERVVTVIDEDGETFVCRFEDGQGLRIFDKSSGEEVFAFDVAEFEATLGDAMKEVQAVMADLDLDIRATSGGDRVVFACDGETVELDLEAAMEGVFTTLAALDDIDIDVDEIVREAHDVRMHRHGDVDLDVEGDADLESLQKELDHLSREIRELKQELRRERDSSR
ncbi:MAG: hypothetical protein Q7W56_05255 [Candidatus Latescibacteria bacterium]|nr:hypothetical protein [Candidatus Latescibacterota bacterium]